LKHFDLAVVDESSQILEPNLVGLLTQVDKFILIGDYKQLPAVVQQSEQDSHVNNCDLNDICLDNCRNSLFERLIRLEEKRGCTDFTGVLRHQGRMHPDIAKFPNEHFYFKEKLEPIPLPHQLDNAIAHRMVFIPSEFCKRPDISDKVNINEAHIVCNCLKKIYHQQEVHFDPAKTVGVIVPYRNQIALIRKELEKTGIPELEKISIDTVERYQGSQRDVIIYSFTIQNLYQLEFLTANSFVEDGHIIDRKLNVAITRARKQLIMTGNPHILAANPLFKELMDFCWKVE
jgi:superfamily I DNA and/or RNA helicase